MPSSPSERTIAMTAIEHHDIVITVASLIRERESSQPSTASATFVTMILGGPLAGPKWEDLTWSRMIRNHASAVSRVADLVADQAHRSDEHH
jgi:hypothetical protein